jgi:hypothetical protein
MQFEIVRWKVKELLTLYKEDRLNLTPPYQRNFIWSIKDQKALIDSILIKEFPLPTFFIRKVDDNSYEMVDGQQRTRTILAYFNNHFEVDLKFSESIKKKIEEFDISVTIITEIRSDESIEEFYTRVNKTGLKLNKPELAKAEHFDTNFLALNEELAREGKLQSLNLFGESSTKRMNDIDLVSELVAYLVYNIYDKKEKVDDLYKNDITIPVKESLSKEFNNVLNIIFKLNSIYPLKKTRYRQRNDFFTLFSFIHKHLQKIKESDFIEFYKVLIAIQDEISPSNELCEPLKDYAINCVSQSNSKKARLKRLSFFEELLLGSNSQPNEVQNHLIEFYDLEGTVLSNIGNFYTINYQEILEEKEIVI